MLRVPDPSTRLGPDLGADWTMTPAHLCHLLVGAEWWEPEAVWKMHYQVTLEDGRESGIFRNYKTGSWYRAL